MVIGTVEEIESLKETILINAQKTVEQLSVKIASLPAMSFLAEVKFDGVGIDPLKGTELNFIEQLNQKYIEDSRHIWEGHLREVRYTTVGSVIGTHLGPGAVVVAFFKNQYNAEQNSSD